MARRAGSQGTDVGARGLFRDNFRSKRWQRVVLARIYASVRSYRQREAPDSGRPRAVAEHRLPPSLRRATHPLTRIEVLMRFRRFVGGQAFAAL